MRRINPFDLMFILILILAFVIRLHNFDYPLVNGETHRDYLVGRHIVKYQEFPLTGPCCLFNGTFGGIRNSPVYYYLLAGFLAIKDDIMFLGLVNIVLQICIIIMIYILAKKLFSLTTALVTVILFSFNWEILRQSLFMWQPHLMHPFLILSYLLLALSYLKKNYLLTLLSISSFFLAAAIHNSVYAILPIYIVLIFLVLKKHKESYRHFVYTAIVAIFSPFLLYLPWLTHLRNNPINLINLTSVQFSTNLFNTTSTLINIFSLNYLTLFGILLGVFYLIFLKKGYTSKHFLIIISLTIVQFLLVASSFKTTLWPFYMTPILFLFVMFISEVINSTFDKNFLLKSLKILLIILLLKSFTNNFQTLSLQTQSASTLSTKGNFKSIERATDVIKKHIKDVHSFSLKVYAPEAESPLTADLPFWTKLEKDLGVKFFTIIDKDHGYQLTNTERSIFIICQSRYLSINITSECLRDFFDKNKAYQLVNNIYHKEPFSIYLAKKI